MLLLQVASGKAAERIDDARLNRWPLGNDACRIGQETVMMEFGEDPVEISVHFGPDDWTETRLTALVGSYQDKLHAMGAPSKDTVTEVDKREDGSVSVRVSWDRRGTVRNTMTGEDAAGRLVPHGNKPGLIMYTDQDGETYLEVPKKQSSAPPDPVVRARRTEAASLRGERSAVPWFWVAGIAAGVLATTSGIGWLRHKIRGTKNQRKEGKS